ncbi:MAG: hypothetical protein GX456_12305 [Verrucomicrobia bacterium]|nr:hypothetical protein [Verrucomicrobiota bacterium]
MLVSKPPKGGTLTAVGAASPNARSNPSPSERSAALQANCVSVPIWPHPISPMIPMVSHALTPMQWALAGAKRLECGSLLPLCSYAQSPCPDHSPADSFPSVRGR